MIMQDTRERGNNLPNYLRRNFFTNAIGKFATRIAKLTTLKTEVKGRENVPADEPFLLISNHFGGSAEGRALLAEFGNRHIHQTAERHTNFEAAGFAGKAWQWVLRAVQALPIDASVRESDRFQFLRNGEELGADSLKLNQAVLRDQPAQNRTFFETAQMLLQRGEPIIMYPEGTFIYEYRKGPRPLEGSASDPRKPAMKQGYRGAEFIARMYQRKTSQPLKILPVASLDSQFTASGRPEMQILPPVTLTDYEKAKESDETQAAHFTDFVMLKIAAALPPEFRGYYSDKVE